MFINIFNFPPFLSFWPGAEYLAAIGQFGRCSTTFLFNCHFLGSSLLSKCDRNSSTYKISSEEAGSDLRTFSADSRCPFLLMESLFQFCHTGPEPCLIVCTCSQLWVVSLFLHSAPTSNFDFKAFDTVHPLFS